MSKTPPPLRPKNIDLRPREYLTEKEVNRLIEAARNHNKYGHRDATMILLAYRHGLRVSELCALRWSQVDLETGTLHVNRVHNGSSSTQPLGKSEVAALNKLLPSKDDRVFMSERRSPVTPAGIRKMIRRLGAVAGFTFPVHPHMLRHGCGFKLANDGHDTRLIQAYLGHRNIQNTVIYTELASNRFKGFWGD